ncbi:TonB-dependent receptor plug domain-containing protein [Candidatus Reidiella endopervernicosa]|uniref:TonB-dependent receptor plug domain-containing protein n=1 Tax=Candidatus Reidiella endopervernicosa TaxID=2738883 RepID=UPI001F2A3E25|nr:TonB-dependent receptor [Candidatus Reidiella endopervernicosa]
MNPRLALVWQSTDKFTTKLMYGEAFKAPSFQQLFAETSFTLPNPDLDPERSETLELAFSYAATKNLNLGLNIYHFQQSDFIRAQTVMGLSKRQYMNSGEHTIRGVEVEARLQATKTCASRVTTPFAIQMTMSIGPSRSLSRMPIYVQIGGCCRGGTGICRLTGLVSVLERRAIAENRLMTI